MLLDFNIGGSQVILIAKEFCIFVGITHYGLDIAVGIDAANVSRVVHLPTKQQRCNYVNLMFVSIMNFEFEFILCWFISIRMPIRDM